MLVVRLFKIEWSTYLEKALPDEYFVEIPPCSRDEIHPNAVKALQKVFPYPVENSLYNIVEED